jgi:hypothetical protein
MRWPSAKAAVTGAPTPATGIQAGCSSPPARGGLSVAEPTQAPPVGPPGRSRSPSPKRCSTRRVGRPGQPVLKGPGSANPGCTTLSVPATRGGRDHYEDCYPHWLNRQGAVRSRTATAFPQAARLPVTGKPATLLEFASVPATGELDPPLDRSAGTGGCSGAELPG